jgi:hypothetical protein
MARLGGRGTLLGRAHRPGRERMDKNLICDRCATDADDPWTDPHATLFGAPYRVTAFNADGGASGVRPALVRD